MFPNLQTLLSFNSRLEEDHRSADWVSLLEFYSSVDLSHVVEVPEKESLTFASLAFLKRIRENLEASGKFSPDELREAMIHARAYAGGLARGEQRRTPVDDDGTGSIAASEHYWQHNAFADVAGVKVGKDHLTDWLQITPRAGTVFNHPTYGKVVFSKKMAEQMVGHFQAGIYQEHIPIDAEHESKLSGATGYYRELRVGNSGEVEARLELTPRGETLLKTKQMRYFSPEFFRKWEDPASGESYENVLVGGALTSRPFFKDKSLAPLIAANEFSVFQGGPAKETSVKDRWQKNEDGTFVLDDEGNPTPTEEYAEVLKAQTDAAEAYAALEDDEDGEGKKKSKTKVKEDPKEDDPKVKATESFAEQFPDEAKVMEEQAKTIGTMNQDAQRRVFTDIVTGNGGAGDGLPFIGDASTHVSLLMDFAEAFGEESTQIVSYVANQREHAEQMKRSALFSEQGSMEIDKSPGTAAAKVEAEATKLREADSKMTYGEAVAQVARDHPELYAAYTQENGL